MRKETMWGNRNKEYRYTVWLKCNPKTETEKQKVFGNELYDLRTDTFENVNLATDSRFKGIQKQLHNQLVAGGFIRNFCSGVNQNGNTYPYDLSMSQMVNFHFLSLNRKCYK